MFSYFKKKEDHFLQVMFSIYKREKRGIGQVEELEQESHSLCFPSLQVFEGMEMTKPITFFSYLNLSWQKERTFLQSLIWKVRAFDCSDRIANKLPFTYLPECCLLISYYNVFLKVSPEAWVCSGRYNSHCSIDYTACQQILYITQKKTGRKANSVFVHLHIILPEGLPLPNNMQMES